MCVAPGLVADPGPDRLGWPRRPLGAAPTVVPIYEREAPGRIGVVPYL